MKLGKVKEVHRYPLNDYLEIDTDAELIKKKVSKNLLIPHIFDTYILDVNVEEKVINTTNTYAILENS